jgi:3-oxoacyl-[acyl-carrier protein] reductase
MDLGIRDKVFMVAASSKGLGFGIAGALASDGARLSLASRSAHNIEAAASKLRETHGVEARGYTFDATDAGSITDWCKKTVAEFGRIDGLVVNAGGPPPGQFDSFDDAAWTRAYELTLLSAVRMIRAVLPTMRSRRCGSILAVTSTSVKEPIDGLLLSNVFRSGVSSLVKSLSREIAKDGIRINNLVPGRVDTERVRAIDGVNAGRRGVSPDEQRQAEEANIPMGRYAIPSEFGAAAAFLLSDAASYLTGATLLVDGGQTKSLW